MLKTTQMKEIIIIYLSILLLVITSACASITLTPQGEQTAAIRSDAAINLPGRPFDSCRTIAHLETEYTFECRSTYKLALLLRNIGGAAGANLVLITKLIDPGHACYHKAAGIGIFCEPETLQAAGISSENLMPGITPLNAMQGLFGYE